MADSAVPVLVTQSALEARLPGHGAAVVRLDADAGEIAEGEPCAASGAPGAGNLAYVI